uniref:fructose-2,6-bisphosphatase TIGAR isoform X1 n=1 Tax=Jaculus jaculus TaxID=51337 RepID=UPI001E1B40FC|nr:fructose-2,6-bisphosphatase TIGAR isoform X1 [Jaculus jaculus]
MPRFALTVIRHGETRLNKEKILQGQGVDEPLSETGFQQAAAAGRFLNKVRFTHAFSSDLMRTKQTMHGILEESTFCKDMTVNYDLRLRERMLSVWESPAVFWKVLLAAHSDLKYGAAEGKALSELRAMAKDAGEECPTFTPPGGETLDEVQARGKDFFGSVCQIILEGSRKEEGSPDLEASLAEVFPLDECSDSASRAPGLAASVLVVSHGAYMRSLFGYFLTDLQCSLPASLGRFELSSVSPNTGISVFLIEVEEGKDPAIQCVCMNLQDHLNVGSESC